VPYLDPAPPRSASGFVRITLPWSSGYVQQNLGVTPQSFYNSPPLRYRRRFYSSGGERCEVLLTAHYQLGKAVIPLKNNLHIEETAHQLLSCASRSSPLTELARQVTVLLATTGLCESSQGHRRLLDPWLPPSAPTCYYCPSDLTGLLILKPNDAFLLLDQDDPTFRRR
jgi:hypothetical protein